MAVTDKTFDAEWLMVDLVLEPTMALTEAERCICGTPCGDFRREARVCPASGALRSVFCEICSDYMCEYNIHGHSECDNGKHVCDRATCLQRSGLTAAETAVAMVKRLGARGESGSLRAARPVIDVSGDEDIREGDMRGAKPKSPGGEDAQKGVVTGSDLENLEFPEYPPDKESDAPDQLLTRLLTATTALLKEVVDAKGVEDRRYPPDTEISYSPYSPSYSPQSPDSPSYSPHSPDPASYSPSSPGGDEERKQLEAQDRISQDQQNWEQDWFPHHPEDYENENQHLIGPGDEVSYSHSDEDEQCLVCITRGIAYMTRWR